MSRVMISYFSLTGNTGRLARLIGDFLREEKGFLVDYYKLPEESAVGSFFRNALNALFQKRVHLKEVPDLSPYPLLFLGTPVWSFNITPAMRTLLESVSLRGKKVFLFTTYGSGAGKEKAMRNFKRLVEKRGGEIIGTFGAQERDIPGHFQRLKAILKATQLF